MRPTSMLLPQPIPFDGAAGAAFPLGAFADCFFFSGDGPSTEKVCPNAGAQRENTTTDIMRTRVRFTETLTMGVAAARCADRIPNCGRFAARMRVPFQHSRYSSSAL